MKIGYLISNYFPSVGGAQVCIHHVANRIFDAGEVTIVVTSAHGGSDDRFFKYKIVRLNPLLNRLLFMNFPLGKAYLENILQRLQKRYNFDIWHVTIGYPLGAASADFFNRTGIPCVLRCSGEDIQIAPLLNYGYRLNKKVEMRIKQNYRKFTAVVALSDSMKEDYLSVEVPQEKIHLIPNGVDCSRFEISIDRERIRNELGVSNNQNFIITVGRNHPKKGFKYIPQMIKRLVRKDVDFKWLLVGKNSSSVKLLAEKEGVGEYLISEEVKSGISENGKFEIPGDKLIRYYKASDVFVFPTLIETFGKVIIEAMAAGLPIVTTNAPGVNEIIKDGENGLKNKTGDIEGLTDSILKLFSNQELAQKLSENALKDARNYDWSKVTDKYLKLYKNTVDFKWKE